MPTPTRYSGWIRRPILALVLLLSQPILADTVYKSTGPHGPVYSDIPSPGSQPIELPPPNVADPPVRPAAEPKAPAPTMGAPAPEAVSYRSLRITLPEDEGSSGDNTATFEVRVAADPALQYGFGHAFVVRLNGKTVDRRYTTTEMMIPPEFFDEAIRAGERFHLEVSIVDRDGGVLIEAAPVDFTMRHITTRPDLPARPLPVRPGRR